MLNLNQINSRLEIVNDVIKTTKRRLKEVSDMSMVEYLTIKLESYIATKEGLENDRAYLKGECK